MTEATNLNPSGHFADFAPTLDGTLGGYSPVMAGAGRWFAMANDQVMFGVLWTDDKDALGLLATEASDPAAVFAMNATLDENHAAGVTAADVFDEMFADYPTADYGEGDLADLYAAF